MRPPGAMSFFSGAASRCSGPSRMLAKTRSNGARARRRCAVTPSALHTSNCAGTVQPGVGAGDADRFGVDVGCQHALPQGAGRRNGKHATAGAEIENAQASPAPRFAEAVERQEAAARGAVVAGAESERRLDLDADPVGRNVGAVVGTVNEKPPGPDGLEACEALSHPVLRGRRARRQAPSRPRDQRLPRPAIAPPFRPPMPPKWIVTCQRPWPLSTRLTATSPSTKHSVKNAAILRADCSSVSSLAACCSRTCERQKSSVHQCIFACAGNSQAAMPAAKLDAKIADLSTHSSSINPQALHNISSRFHSSCQPRPRALAIACGGIAHRAISIH